MSGRESMSPVLGIMELANMISVPMSLNAVVRLKIADAIWQGGSNAPLSVAEILSAIASPPTAEPPNLQRILRLLTSHGVFEERSSFGERVYSLTEVGKTLVTEPNGVSCGQYVLLHHQDALLGAWPLVHEAAVLDPSSEQFSIANKDRDCAYYGNKPEMNDPKQKALHDISQRFMKALLDGYDGPQGVRHCLRMIMGSMYGTDTQGINFDNPVLGIMEIANMISVPMSLNAAVRLNVADAIWQRGSNKPLSAAKILSAAKSHSATAAPPTPDPANLQRILNLLTSYGVFREHGSVHKREYSLTEVGKTLVKDANGVSCGQYVLLHHQDALLRAWPLVHEAVLDPSSEPFSKANKKGAYAYYGDKPGMNDLMQKAMHGISVRFMEAFLGGYDGFQGVETLVDVGRSSGDCLKMIMKRNQTVIRGINYIPDVNYVPAAKSAGNNRRGLISHVDGNMLQSIPDGDAIFLKWVLTTCTDEDCLKVLKNCYKALLPAGGKVQGKVQRIEQRQVQRKVIACEPVLSDKTDDSCRNRALLAGDIFVMTIYNAKGRHRTEEEYKKLGNSAGFSSSKFKAKHFKDHLYTVLEFYI